MFIHDPAFALPKVPPFRAGVGPFRVKGSALLDELELHQSRLTKEKYAAALAALPGDDARRFFAGRFSRTEWYDLAPLVYLTAAVTQVRGIPLAQELSEIASFHIERAARGFSGVVLRMVSYETVAVWLPRLAATYYDFGSVESCKVSDGRVRGVRTGVPHFFVQMWGTVATMFVEKALVHAGAKNPRVFTSHVTEDGERGGERIYSIPFEVTWG